MRDERLLVIILYTPAERFLGDERLPAIYTPLFLQYSDKLEVVCRILYSVDGDILLYPILHVRPGRCFVLPAINTHRIFSKCKKIEMRTVWQQQIAVLAGVHL